MFDIKQKRVLRAKNAFVTGVILVTCLSAPARAQDTDAKAQTVSTDAGPGDIVVTAERRKSSLQKTALSISVIPSTQLDRANVQDITGLNGYAPGLTVTKTGGRETVPTIRGIGSSTPENTGSTAPGVAMFVDGVYIGDSLSLGQNLFDFDHIEILRGPQGTLYGVSAIGGAIILVTNQPSLTSVNGTVDMSLGNYNYTRARAALNLPFSDTIAVRVSAQKLNHDGFTLNTESPHHRLDDADDLGLKGAVLWQPAPNFSATLTGQYTRVHENGPAQKGLDDPNSDPRVLSQDYLGKNNYQSKLVHLNLKWDLPAFSLSSVTAYRRYTSDFAENVTFSTFERFQPYENVPVWKHDERTVSQEFDILSPAGSRLQWTGGIFLMRRKAKDYILEYQGNDQSVPQPAYVDPSLPGDQLPTNLAYGNATTDIRTAIEPFAQLTYPITDKLRLTGGARYNYESHDHRSHNFSAFGNSPIFGKTDKTKVPTWRAELAYDATPNTMIYASASTGYKAGGVNGNATTALVPQTFRDEHNTAFEAGVKTYFLDRKLRLNVDGFYYVYKNMQYIETDPIPFDQGMSNIPDVHVWGGEAELSYIGMADRLHINGNLSVQHGEVISHTRVLSPTIVNGVYASSANCAFGGQYYNPACWADVIAAAQDISGNSPPGLAKVAGSVDLSYAIPLAGGTLTPWIQFLYEGARQARIFNEASLDHEPGYSLLNLSLSYQPARSKTRFNLSISNVTDRAGVNSRYTSPYESGLTSQQFVAPRQIIGSIAYNF